MNEMVWRKPWFEEVEYTAAVERLYTIETQRIDCPVFEDLDKDQLVLGENTDPFFIGNARRRWAEWFASHYNGLGIGEKKLHLRGMHYVFVSQSPPIVMPTGKPYINDPNSWGHIGPAARDARYLGFVDVGNFDDQRNPDPFVELITPKPASIYMYKGRKIEPLSNRLPMFPWLALDDPTIPSSYYHVEVWIEKSTMNGILEPLVKEYGANLVTGVGDMSVTGCDRFIDRAIASGRPARILYVSDFDPSGHGIPPNVARKIEFRLRDRRLRLDVQVRPIALTLEQCEQYALPETPLKSTDPQAELFRLRWNRDGTELDALEALYPTVFAGIVRTELDRYYDREVAEQVQDRTATVRHKLHYVNEMAPRKYEAEIVPIRQRYKRLVELFNRGTARLAPEWDRVQEKIENRLKGKIPYRVNWPRAAEGQDDEDPMFDSIRDYDEQYWRYYEHERRHIQLPEVTAEQKRENAVRLAIGLFGFAPEEPEEPMQPLRRI